MPLIEFRKEGLYVPAADVYIDPWHRVPKALITHGHSDHSRWGHQKYLCTHESKPILRCRLGDVTIQSVAFGEEVVVHGVKFTFLPAGHIVGSAQIRIEHRGEVWVVSGDYKVENDGISGRFEPVRCHTFITECTFGLPIYSWLPQERVFEQINQWWQMNRSNKVTSILNGYSLGKAQRLLCGLDLSIGPVFVHGAILQMNEAIRLSGIRLPETRPLHEEVSKSELEGALVLTPSGAGKSGQIRRIKEVSQAGASGWMQLRGARRWGGMDRGFALSDHADWEGLNKTIADTGAETIYVTHGPTEVFGRWLAEQGYNVRPVKTKFTGEQAAEPVEEGWEKL